MSEHALELPDGDWADFLAEMEASAPDETETRIDWLLEQMRDGVAEIEKNADVAKRRRDMIDDWEAGERMKIERRNEYLVGQIGQLVPPNVEAMVKQTGKKSRSLPHGSFGYRQRPDRVEIADMGSAVRYALEMELPTKIVETVSKTDLKTHAKATGVAEGEGWHMESGASEFYVKPAK